MWQGLSMAGVLSVGYAAIRADLAGIREKAEAAGASAARAHDRIDNFIGGKR